MAASSARRSGWVGSAGAPAPDRTHRASAGACSTRPAQVRPSGAQSAQWSRDSIRCADHHQDRGPATASATRPTSRSPVLAGALRTRPDVDTGSELDTRRARSATSRSSSSWPSRAPTCGDPWSRSRSRTSSTAEGDDDRCAAPIANSRARRLILRISSRATTSPYERISSPAASSASRSCSNHADPCRWFARSISERISRWTRLLVMARCSHGP